MYKRDKIYKYIYIIYFIIHGYLYVFYKKFIVKKYFEVWLLSLKNEKIEGRCGKVVNCESINLSLIVVLVL